jgi:hypothetical protein
VIKSREIFVAAADLGTEETLMKELGKLSEQQLGDPILIKIREELERNPSKLQGELTNELLDL